MEVEDIFSPFRSDTPPQSNSPVSPVDLTDTMTGTAPGTPTGSQPGATQSTGSLGAPALPTLTASAPKLGGSFGTAFWIGGPPNEGFNGPALMGPPTPLCFRKLDTSSEIKGFVKRTEGCSTKFKRDDPEFPLVAFADEALKHMQMCGMDTVFHMTGMKPDGTGAKELFSYHTRYTKDEVAAHVAKKIADGVFDELQQAALHESALWLANSLDESLKASLRPKLALRPNGPVLWMMIVSEVQSDSLQRTDLLVEKFKKLTLAQFKGEDVGSYCDAAELILLQLEKDDQLPRLHLMTIVDVFSSASVMDFKIHWMGRRSAVHSFIKESAGKAAAAVSSMPNRIHFSTLLDEGRSLFRELTDGQKWGSTGKAAPTPEQALHNTIKQLNAKVAQLDPDKNSSTPKLSSIYPPRKLVVLHTRT